MLVCSFRKSRIGEVVLHFGERNVTIKCSVKCQSQTKPKTKQYADDKQESFLKET